MNEVGPIKRGLTPLKITLVYFFVGALWLVASERLLQTYVHDLDRHFYLETIGSMLFVFITACMLYLLITRSFSKIEKGRHALQKSMTELAQRTKELNCLYSISRLIERRRYSLKEILQGAVEILPSAWQHAEIACARIILDGQQFKAANFTETPWRQACKLLVKGKPAGRLEVCYLEQRPESDEGPFQKEERSLINAVAERLGKTIERRRAETDLQRSEKRFRDLVENSLTGISIVQDNQVLYQNQEQERLLGPLPRSNLLGDLNNIHPDDVEEAGRLIEAINSGKNRKLDLEFRFYSPDKKENRLEKRWVHCCASIIEYRGKEAILVNMMDITKAKELEHLLTIQDKMASLGRVAAGIAHEIRNPLSGVNIYLNTLKKLHRVAGSEEKVEQIIGQLQSASHKIESVIRRVMDFAKPSEPRFSLIDINQPIEEALKLSAVTMRKSSITIEKALADDLPRSYADPNLIEVMVLNLLNNAAEAMKIGAEDKQIVIASSVQKGDIIIRVLDSGPGVALNIRDKIFDPYFTTKPDGTGIGLSLCQRIITDHAGSLTVTDSELGGAEFRIEIPIKKRMLDS
jgi:PAS domain S-box-containing protein